MEQPNNTNTQLKADIKKLVKIKNILGGDKVSYIDYEEKENFNPNEKPITYTLHTKGHHYRFKATYSEFYSFLTNSLKEHFNNI